MYEMSLFVFFDISNTKIRNRINEKCKDYGLQRMQLSGFKGSLNKKMRERFIQEVKEIIGKEEARLYIQPICSSCEASAVIIDSTPQISPFNEEEIYFGMPLNKIYQDYED